jgi:hypothetical protein
MYKARLSEAQQKTTAGRLRASQKISDATQCSENARGLVQLEEEDLVKENCTFAVRAMPYK